MADYSREAAHRRYAKAYDIANQAGADSQAAVNEAYRQIYNDTEWTPEEGWADQYAGGPAAYKPASYTSSGSSPLDIVVNAANYTLNDAANDRREEELPSTTTENQDLLSDRENEEQKEEEQKKDGSSPLTPMVNRISDQSRDVANMSDSDRFELAKQSLDRSLQTQNDRDQDAARNIMENQLISQYAVSGANPYDDPTFQNRLQQIQNTNDTDEISRIVRDATRRFTGDPDGYNLLGFTSQEMTPDNARNVYEMGFNQLGNIEPTSASADKEARQNLVSLNIPGLDSVFDVDRNLIDDGRSEDSREAMFMTGEQYLRYINDFGIPGRPARQIDPDEIYSKQDEMENYGFIPYLATQEGFDRFHDVASENAVSNLFNNIANARKLATDYTINYGDQTFSGKDLQRNSSVWSKIHQDEVNQSGSYDPNDSKRTFDKSQASEFAVPHKAVYSIRTQDGQSATHEGEPTKQQFSDGHIEYTWPDGTNWSFDDMDDLLASAGVNYQPTTDDDELASMWYEFTPFELDDGTKIRADRAQQMLADVYNNMDEYAYYGPGNIAKPNVDSPLEGLAPWLSDIFTGSAPLFYSPVAGAQAAAGAMNAYQGMKPGYDDYVGGTYSMVSQDPREDQRILATLGNAALPLTERLWGPIGGSVLGGVTKRIPGVKNIGEAIEQAKPWQRYLAGTVGEAAEEIPGNIVEEFMNGSGFDWYANPVLDVNGNPRYDQQGRQMYDPNTPIGQRVGNFLADAPMAMLGGAAMGGILGTTSIPRYSREYAIQQALEGLPKIEEGYSENVTTPLTEREIREYNR